MSENYIIMSISLLIFIGIEFFVLCVGYLDRILKKLSIASVENHMLITNQFNYDWVPAVEKAKHSIFISGIAFKDLCAKHREFRKIPPNIKIEIIMIDNDDSDLLDAFCKMAGQTTPERIKKHYEVLKTLIDDLQKRENTCIKCVDFLMPTFYFGIDIDDIESNSLIRSQHFLHFSPSYDKPMGFEVKSDSDLFYIYKQQIEILREKAVKTLLCTAKCECNKSNDNFP